MPDVRSQKPVCARRRSWGCPLLAHSLVQRLQTEETKSSSSRWTSARLRAGPRFWFSSFRTITVSLCVHCSDLSQCSCGWQRQWVRHRAAHGAGEKWFCLASSAMWQWKGTSCPDPNHPLCSAPGCFLNKALWLPNIIHLPKEPQILPQLPSSSWSEHER